MHCRIDIDLLVGSLLISNSQVWAGHSDIYAMSSGLAPLGEKLFVGTHEKIIASKHLPSTPMFPAEYQKEAYYTAETVDLPYWYNCLL